MLRTEQRAALAARVLDYAGSVVAHDPAQMDRVAGAVRDLFMRLSSLDSDSHNDSDARSDAADRPADADADDADDVIHKLAAELSDASSTSAGPDGAELFGDSFKTQERQRQLQQRAEFCQRVLGLPAGATAIVLNGRLVGPIPDAFEWIHDDFQLFEQTEYERHIRPIAEAVAGLPDAAIAAAACMDCGVRDGELGSYLVMALGSLLNASPFGRYALPPDVAYRHRCVIATPVCTLSPQTPAATLKPLTHGSSGVTLPARHQDDVCAHVTVVMNPASTVAQRLAPILTLLRNALCVQTQLLLNPTLQLTEPPITRFYRYVAAPEPIFDAGGRCVRSLCRRRASARRCCRPTARTRAGRLMRARVHEHSQRPSRMATFQSIPRQPLYTVAIDGPSSWFVEPVEAKYDLDNLHLASVRRGTDVHVIFELSHFVIEGSVRARDARAKRCSWPDARLAVLRLRTSRTLYGCHGSAAAAARSSAGAQLDDRCHHVGHARDGQPRLLSAEGDAGCLDTSSPRGSIVGAVHHRAT